MTRNAFIQQATLALMGNPAFLENSCRVDVGGIDYSAAEFAAKMARKLEHHGVAFDIDTTHLRETPGKETERTAAVPRYF